MEPVDGAVLTWPRGRLDFTSGCLVMGVLNVTPDSFSDGGQFFDADAAVQRGLQMAEQGAAIVDVGGESTRPGSQGVATAEQIRRVVPVVEGIARGTQVPVSIDTHDPHVAEAALSAGASMVNDITALSDERMGELAAEREVPVILMHMRGTPATMQNEPHYDDVVAEVVTFLRDRARRAEAFGVPPQRIFIDPGIGFGKTLEHNLLLLRHVDRFVATGYRVLVGASRKSFIGKITGRDLPADSVFGTAATVALCAAAGASVVRVHDVQQMLDVIKVTQAIGAADASAES